MKKFMIAMMVVLMSIMLMACTNEVEKHTQEPFEHTITENIITETIIVESYEH